MKYDDAFEALVLANPIADADAYLDQIAEPTVFLTMTMERIDEKDTTHRNPEPTRATRKWKPLVVAIGAAAIVVAAVLLATALQPDGVEPADLPTVPFETPGDALTAISAMTTVEEVAAVYRPNGNEPQPGQLDDIAFHAIVDGYPDTSSCTIHSATSWTCVGPVETGDVTAILGRPVDIDVTIRLSDDGYISSLSLNWDWRFTADEHAIIDDWADWLADNPAYELTEMDPMLDSVKELTISPTEAANRFSEAVQAYMAQR